MRASTILRTAALALGIAAAAPAPEPAAHPHVFIDTGAGFVFDEAGRVAAIRVIWHYDAFASLFIMETLEVDGDGDGVLTEDEKAKIVEDQMTWEDDFAGDSYLAHGGTSIALGGPENGTVTLDDGARLLVSFERRLDTPIDPRGSELTVAIYDPFYYFAYFATHAPDIAGAPEGCRAKNIPFEPTEALASLQGSLALLGPDETPEEEGVGALFADRVVLTCD